LWLIRRPNCITGWFLYFFYAWDLISYTLDPKAFLQKRGSLLGKNFAALGRIIVGEYDQVVEIIQSPQKRGAFLGRARLVPSKFAKFFPLFLSDEGAGGGALHSKLHNHFWVEFVPPAMARVVEQDAVFTGYLKEGIRAQMSNKKTQNMEIQKMTVRYIFHAFIGAPLSDSEVDTVYSLFFAANPLSAYIVGGTKPFSGLTALFQCSRRKGIRQITDVILKSPLMADYVPSDETGNQSEEDYAAMIFSILGIAGIVGTSGLLIQVLTAIPKDAVIDLEDKKEVMFAVLEAARIRAPVNTVNLILSAAMTMTVNGAEKIIPAGSVVGGSIGLASLDAAMFEQPDTFNHHRDNLVKMVLNFNAIGYEATGAGTRQCPGRNVAMKMACDILTLSRNPDTYRGVNSANVHGHYDLHASP
jgi:hypothetical protein